MDPEKEFNSGSYNHFTPDQLNPENILGTKFDAKCNPTYPC